MPRTKKPAGTAVDVRNGRRVELEGEGGLQPFALPAKRPAYAAETLAAWDGVWADPVRRAWTSGDRVVLLRWADAVDRAARSLRRADRAPVLAGGNGQLAEHPSYRTAAAMLAVAERCEAQLGVGALNRERLGLTIGAARRSLEDLNARYAGGGEDEGDPR